MRIKKNLILLFAALLISQSLAGCAEDGKETESIGDTADTITETLSAEEQKLADKDAYFASLPGTIQNAGGEINILTEVTEIYYEEEGLNGDKMNDAMYNRNLEVEARLNIKIKQDLREQGSGDVLTVITQNVMAGDGTYDIGNTWTREMADLFVSGALTDANEVPYMQLNEAWWNQSANYAFTYAGFRYCLISSLNHYAGNLAEIMMFNKDMCTDYGIEIPYDAVREGRWTFDLMYEMIEMLPMDSNGDGTVNADDIMGLVGQLSDVEASMVSCGVDYFVKDDEDIPQFILASELNESKFSTVFDIMTDKNRVVLVEIYAGLEEPWTYWSNAFQADMALFMMNFPVNLYANAEMESDYGILPMPKYNEDQETYRTMTNSYWTSSLCIPKVVDADPGDIGLFLEAMSYLSYMDVDAVFAQSYLENRYIRDEDSVEMMQIAMSNKYFDPSFAMSSQWQKPMSILSGIVKKGENTFASTVASKAEAVQNAVYATKEAIEN